MVAFENKMYLHASWVIPILLVGYAIHLYFQTRARNQFADPVPLKKLISGSDPFRRFVKIFLLVSAYAALVIAIANPQQLNSGSKPGNTGATEVIFALDISNSMRAADILPNRLTRAQSFMQEALKEMPGTQVGLVVFAGKAHPYLPLTADLEAAGSAIKNISTNLASTQGSSLNEALKISGLLLNNKSGNAKAICLLSDGETHTQDFKEQADSLRKAGISLFAVGVGTSTGDVIPVTDQAGLVNFKKDVAGQPIISKRKEESLKQLAGQKAEHYIPLENNETAVSNLIKLLPKSGSPGATSGVAKKDYFPHFMLLAFFLLIAEVCIPDRKKLKT